MKRLPAPPICPVCGEDVPKNALACPECGADHESGWREDADSIDAAGDDEFDYQQFAENEFGRSSKPPGLSKIWWITAIVVFLILTAGYFLGIR